MAAITHTESGGNYRAVGPPTPYGRAYGRYQVLAPNIAPWTRAALGRALTVDEFLADREAQDITTGYIMTLELIRHRGDIHDVIAVWFSGKPYAGNTRCDVNMCTPTYVALAAAHLYQ